MEITVGAHTNVPAGVTAPGVTRPPASGEADALRARRSGTTTGKGEGQTGLSRPQAPPGGSSAFAAQELAAGDESGPTRDKFPFELSEDEKAVVADLQARDREVRAHERAHAAVGGQYAGQPKLQFTTGPDGRRYAIAGEVSIDSSPIPDDPEATIAKLRVVRAAALAPAKPSGPDRAVAAQAQAGITQAQADLNAKRAEETAAVLDEDGEDDSIPVIGPPDDTTAPPAGTPPAIDAPDIQAPSPALIGLIA